MLKERLPKEVKLRLTAKVSSVTKKEQKGLQRGELVPTPLGSTDPGILKASR